MITTTIEPTTNAIWIDVTAPNDDEFNELSSRFGIDLYLFKECMNPEHFPRFDAINEKHKQIILRIFDDGSTHECDTVRELTRKIAIFYGTDFVITIHRREIAWLQAMKPKALILLSRKNGPESLVTKIIQEVFLSFEAPIQAASRRLEEFELKVFRYDQSQRLFQDLYYNRRKAAVFKEMVDQTALLLTDQLFFPSTGTRNSSVLKRLKADGERLYFYSLKLYESVSYLINLHVSLSSQRTNEVMRVLTVFSAFFLPLTFIVGIYGMNFKVMPELENPYGYYLILLFMAAVSIGIFVWFRRKGWLKFN